MARFPIAEARDLSDERLRCPHQRVGLGHVALVLLLRERGRRQQREEQAGDRESLHGVSIASLPAVDRRAFLRTLGTVFDLLLPRTYRDGGPPIIAWDVAGLRVGLDGRGTVNRPGDRDDGWTVEIALP